MSRLDRMIARLSGNLDEAYAGVRSPWDLGVAHEQKSDFPVERYSLSNWSNPIGPINTFGTFGSTIDYATEAGDLVDNSAVMACMNWLMRNFPKSAPRVVLQTEDGLEPVKNHVLTAFLKKPNPFYSGTQLWQGTVLSYNWNGNAYWRLIRNQADQVIHAYYEPHWTIRPRRINKDDFISEYQLWRGNEWKSVKTEDIVHFRNGIDPRNPMLGLSPLASVLREVATDNQAAMYAYVMFRNLGVVGGVVTPKDGQDEIGDVNKLKAELQSLTTGDNRGMWLVYSLPLDVTFPEHDPAKLDTRANRTVSEERIAGCLNIPASIAGLGAGLAHSSASNRDDDARRAYDDNIIPTQASIAEELDIQLLPQFSQVEAETIEFDNRNIRVLRGDQERKDTVTALLWNAGVLKRSEARLRAGYSTPKEDVSGDVYKTDLAPVQASGGFGSEADGAGTGADSIASGGKARTNGHTDLRAELAALLLPEGKATGKVDRERQAIEDELIEDIAAELSDLYAEAEGKI